MDSTIVDTDPPPQSKSDADLALYLATSNTGSSRASPLPWSAADDGYGFGNNALGLYDASNDVGYGWSEEEADRYIVPDHPLVEHEIELSDHSYTTDSGSRDSSNHYSDPSFINHTADGYRGDRVWNTFSTYGSHGQEILLSPLQSGPHVTSDLHLPENNPSIYLASSTSASHFSELPRFNVLPHLHSSPQQGAQLLPPLDDILVDHPSPLSSTSSVRPPSSNEGQYVSPDEISAPYVSPKNEVDDTDLKGTSSSDETPIRNSTRLTRLRKGKSIRGGRGGARGGRHKGLTETRHGSGPKTSPESPPKRRRPSYSSSSSTSDTSQVSIPLHKRPRRGTTSRAVPTFTDSESGDDSDAYLPPKSPSPYASPSDDARSPSPEYNQHKPKKRGGVKKSDASKMSAAEALAQIAGGKAKMETGDGDSQAYQPLYKFETGKRKNGTIPQPVPVPHLIKKSRGRKVPYVDARAARPRTSEDELDLDVGGSRGTPSRKGRGGRRGAGGARTFVCAVPGCGKCFVRGEHLKRHVRSIHTHDKPHQCPYDGCDKSFSRRDNLGQHVRLHLMDSL